MKLLDLIKSFDDRANGTPKGEFYLTEKQYNYALSLAEREHVHLPKIAEEMGVSFRTWAIGKNARFYGNKYAKLQMEKALAERDRACARVSSQHQ